MKTGTDTPYLCNKDVADKSLEENTLAFIKKYQFPFYNRRGQSLREITHVLFFNLETPTTSVRISLGVSNLVQDAMEIRKLNADNPLIKDLNFSI